jgi:hypothetical protein
VTHLPQSLYAASLSAWWCCPDCDAVRLCCPGCAERLAIRRPSNHPPALPFHPGPIRCPDTTCQAILTATICGYRPNPTGDAPATRSPLSDRLPVIERPPLPRPAPRAPELTPEQTRSARYPRRRGYINAALELEERPRPPRPAGPARPSWPHKPCPPAAARKRLRDWAADGLLPDGAAPCSIAAAYRRLFGGAEPVRDRQTRIYSYRELRGCLWLLRQGQGPEVAQ